MKKFVFKFIVLSILCLFSSFIYADGVFSEYYNARFSFLINVPITKYEDGMGEIIKLDFVKNSKYIPSKNFFNAREATNSDGLSIKNKKGDITILAYGANFLNLEDLNGLGKETIIESFQNEGLNYNQFIKKYYNGRLPRNIDVLKYAYNKDLFIYGENVAYNTIGRNFYAISYIENNQIIYRKVIYNEYNDSYLTFMASYLPKDKKIMDSIVTEMAQSFRAIR